MNLYCVHPYVFCPAYLATDLLTNIPDNYKPKVEEDPDIIEIIDTPTHSHKGTEVQVEL